MIGLPILNCEGFGPARSEEALFLGLSVYDNSPSGGCQLLTIALLTIGVDNFGSRWACCGCHSYSWAPFLYILVLFLYEGAFFVILVFFCDFGPFL